MPEKLRHLEALSAALGDAVSVDDVARASLGELLRMDDVVRAGLAVSDGGGRQLTFVSTDDDSFGPVGVRWCSIDGLANVPLAHTVRTAEAVYLGSDERIAEEFFELAERQRRIGTRAMASVPMLVDGSCVGGLLVSYGSPQAFEPDQQAFLAAFAAQVSQALRRGLAYHVQRSTSEQLQRSLMPHSLPELPGLALGAHYQPAGLNVDVGGDWYDVMSLPDGSAVVALGDVMGKGVPAAVVMSEVRSATRAYALLDPDPAVVLSRLDQLIVSSPFGDQVVTMLYGVVDPERTTVRIGSAGHLPPLVVSAAGRPELIDAELGPALGLGAELGISSGSGPASGSGSGSPWSEPGPGSGSPWSTHTVELEDNMTLLFYSDGLVESRAQDLGTGIDVLRDLVAQMPARRRNPRELCARLTGLMVEGEVDDDVALLALTTSRAQKAGVQDLPADSSAAALARRFVRRLLREWQVDDDVVDTAELCVSELVTNAVIHSRSTSTLTVRADDDYLLVMVQDRGAVGPVRRPEGVDPEAISGRGLSLVDALASAWSAEHSADGTTVWFELPLDPSSGSGPGSWDDIAS